MKKTNKHFSCFQNQLFITNIYNRNTGVCISCTVAFTRRCIANILLGLSVYKFIMLDFIHSRSMHFFSGHHKMNATHQCTHYRTLRTRCQLSRTVDLNPDKCSIISFMTVIMLFF